MKSVFNKPTFISTRKSNLLCVAIALLVYTINKLWLCDFATGIFEIVCRSYLNDLVCPLFFLGFANILFLWAGIELKTYFSCVLFVMVCGLIWEYFAPIINAKAVSDPLDLLCYFIGVNIYWAILMLDIRRNN